MILFDLNILIYAHRADQLDHDFFRDKLKATIESCPAFGVTPLVAAGFVRLVTNPAFPNGPTPLPQALAVIDSLLQCENACWLSPGQQHWKILSALCRDIRCTGKAVADAQHAAIAIEYGATWISRDTDFNRFVNRGLIFEYWQPDA